MKEALSHAILNNVVIYTVVLGEVNDEYLTYIASRTGGKYIKTTSSMVLDEIYTRLHKYIVNNYCITYEIEQNTKVDPKNLYVSITSYEVTAYIQTVSCGSVINANEQYK